MNSITITRHTTPQQVREFGEANAGAEIRSKRNFFFQKILYTHVDNHRPSRNPEARAAKQHAGRLETSLFIERRLGRGPEARSLILMLHGGGALTGAGLAKVAGALENAERNRTIDDAKTIQGTLRNPALRPLFAQHLATEFSTENIKFYHATEELAELAANPRASGAQVYAKADQIAARFLGEGTPEQVNVPNNVANNIRAEIDRGRANPGAITRGDIDNLMERMGVGRDEIVKLMGSDSFPRFAQSAGLKDALAQL